MIHDRELQLHDGTRLLRSDRYDEIKEHHKRTDEEMRESGVHRIHPSFRLIALAGKPMINSSTGQWLNSELLTMFLFHEMRPLGKEEEIHIIRSKVSKPSTIPFSSLMIHYTEGVAVNGNRLNVFFVFFLFFFFFLFFYDTL